MNSVIVMKHLMNGKSLPNEFIYESCLARRRSTKIHESPHPYPSDARVYTSVTIPNAIYLIITFDPKSNTEPDCDHLLFSRSSIGKHIIPPPSSPLLLLFPLPYLVSQY